MRHRGGLAAGYDERVDGVELATAPHGVGVGAGLAQRGQMLTGVTLKREHPDADAHGLKSRL